MHWIWAVLFPFMCWASLEQMTLEEKIGQLFVAPCAPLLGEEHFADWERLVDEYHIGNALLKQSDPATQIQFLERLQKRSDIPLLIAADAEWGLGMRMSETVSFPRNLTLGAVRDLSLIEEMGRWIGRQARQVGIHLNLAPVADVNINLLNPIIHMRSFGQDPIEVASRCGAIIRGMHTEGLLCCAKHFPGHGDTGFDSHLCLPTLPFDMQRLWQVELIPFTKAIEEGVDCIMSGHLLIPALDTYPASLSSVCMKDLLRSVLKFRGLAITDALNMNALTDHWSVEEIAIQAFAAGHDLLLYGAHLKDDVDELLQDQIPRAFHALRQAFIEGRFSIEDLDERVGRILDLKERMQPPPLLTFLMNPEILELRKKLFREALTPIGGFAPPGSFYYVAIGAGENDWIVGALRKQGIEVICVSLDAADLPRRKIPRVVGIHQVKKAGEGFGISAGMQCFIEESELAVFFCSPYACRLFPRSSGLVAYENDTDAEEAALDALMGRFRPHGCLPVKIF